MQILILCVWNLGPALSTSSQMMGSPETSGDGCPAKERMSPCLMSLPVCLWRVSLFSFSASLNVNLPLVTCCGVIRTVAALPCPALCVVAVGWVGSVESAREMGGGGLGGGAKDCGQDTFLTVTAEVSSGSSMLGGNEFTHSLLLHHVQAVEEGS